MSNNILDLRERKGVSQAELARQLTVSRSWMNKIENGKVPLGYAMASRIARVLECNVQDIFRD